MKHWLAVGILLFCAVTTFAQKMGNADERAIRELDKQFLQAAHDRDVEKAVSFYADDASVYPDNAPIATGKEAIRAMWQQFLSDKGTTISFWPTKIEISKAGDMALDVGTTEVKTPDGTIAGKYVVVWRKDKGTWKVVADIFNGDQPPAPMK